MRDYIEFFRQFRSRFETTGAIAPSSPFLARALTRPIRRRTPGAACRILEIGPGTGAVTRKIVSLLHPGDEFDLVELNETFAEMLQQQFRTNPSWVRVAEQSRIHICPLQEFQAGRTYDYVVSGLPLNNFPADLVRDILQTCFQLLAPNGVMTFFEYMYVRPIRGMIARGDEKSRLQTIERILQDVFTRHRTQRDWVFANVPPAWVQHLQQSQSVVRE